MNETPVAETRPDFIEVGSGNSARRIAVRARKGAQPGLFWLGGFNSDMKGTKALALDAWAADHGRGCVRFDYSGHGESGGPFVDGTIGRWLEESVTVFAQFCSRARRTPTCPGSTPSPSPSGCPRRTWC
jgi:hypothetical protein